MHTADTPPRQIGVLDHPYYHRHLLFLPLCLTHSAILTVGSVELWAWIILEIMQLHTGLFLFSLFFQRPPTCQMTDALPGS